MERTELCETLQNWSSNNNIVKIALGSKCRKIFYLTA